MKGAMAEPSDNTSNAPKSTRKTTIGNSHHFLRTFRNCQNSLTMDNRLMVTKYYTISWYLQVICIQ